MSNSDDALLTETPDAAWLPSGSTAQVWVGHNCAAYDPAIIVRLLLTRGEGSDAEFFTISTAKGDDLPTLFLGRGDERLTAAEGVEQLLQQIVGVTDVRTSCVGFVRNVVPVGDESYPHPIPHAHVPVFAVEGIVEPIVDGTWYTIEAARPGLHERHWWPIVEHRLQAHSDR